MWGGKKPLWEIWAIIRNLPADSAVGRKVNPEQWRAEHTILADIWDLLMLVNTAVEKGKPDTRQRYPRSGDEERAKAKADVFNDRLLAQRAQLQRQLAAGGDV